MMRRVLGGVLLAAALLTTVVGSAQAFPGVPDCKDPPVAMMPGDGLTGFLDAKPAAPPPPGDPFAAHPTTSVYEQYGYAGLRWATYDIGTAPICADTDAAGDTMVGNWGLDLAAYGVAASNGLHNRIAHPATYMAPLDAVVGRVSAQLKAAIWDPWGAVALLALVGLLIWQSTTGRLSDVAKGAAWAVLVVTVVTGLTNEPVRAATAFDDTITGTIAQIDARTAGLTGIQVGSDPARAQGALVVDRLLYDSWVRGELGNPASATAKTFGPRLFKAQAYTWAEAAQAQDPAKATALADAKTAAWKKAADEIQTKDPAAYRALQGRTGARGGVGWMTTFGAALTNLYRVIADLFVFAGLVMLRFMVMFAPVFAVLAVLTRTSTLVRRGVNVVGASVVNVVAFSAGSAIVTAMVAALLNGSPGQGLDSLTLALCALITLVALLAMWPMLSLTRVVGTGSGHTSILRKAARLAGRAGAAAVGGVLGGAVATELIEDEHDDEDTSKAAQDEPVAETFSREEPEMTEPKQGHAVGVTGQDPPRRPKQPEDYGREPERWVYDPDTKTTRLAGDSQRVEVDAR